MTYQSHSLESGIDLSEIFSILWSHKILISLVTALSVFSAGYYNLTTEKEFTARAVFEINQTNSTKFNLPSQLNSLSALAGIGGQSNSNNLDSLLERIIAREFILRIIDKASLEKDLFFNNYNPDYVDPVWKTKVKNLIGWQKKDATESALIENSIIENYARYVSAKSTDSGAISLSVIHRDPSIAAKYANLLMEEIRKLVEIENREKQNFRLTYLSETLADAIQEMDRTQQKLKEYALENSALAQENFISGSLKLDELRMEKRKVEDIANLLFILENLVQSDNLDNRSYDALRSNHPLVDDVDFRRILGMSETISAWIWPKIETIKAVSATLKDRTKRLNVDIKNIEESAKIYATSAENLAKFTRDAKVSEATYTVLIEQVKSQSLAAGFQPEQFKVFEYATPPIVPSSPNRILIFAFGAALGVFLGCTVALINSIRTGVYYTRSTLIAGVNAGLAIKSSPIKKLSRKSISQIIASHSNHRFLGLQEAEMKLADKKLVYIFNSGGRLHTPKAASILASQSSQSGRKVILCDTTGQTEKELGDMPTKHVSGLSIINVKNNMNVMTRATEASFFTSTKFNSTVKDLIDHFDQVFICSSQKNATLGLMALSEFIPGLVLMAGLRKTRKCDIKKIQTRQPIDLLFYD